MSIPPVTNVVEIIGKGTYPTVGSGGKNIWNVFHYRLLSGLLDTMQNICLAFKTAVLNPTLSTCVSTDYTATAIVARLLDDATFQYIAGAIQVNGGIALPRLPGDVSVTVRLSSILRGKNFRGSKHFGPVPTGFVTKDDLNATGIAAWAAVRTLFFADITTSNGSTMRPVVLSRQLSQIAVNPTTIIASDISGAVINDTIGTMRKRKERTVS